VLFGVKKIIKLLKSNPLWDSFQSNPKKVLTRLAALFFVIWFLFDDYGIVKRVRMEAEYRSLLERQRIEQQKMVDNEQRILHASVPDSIEKAARERYNFRKPNETLFILKGQ
jgi:cell division protein FtsB